jgi:hypothetical protein
MFNRYELNPEHPESESQIYSALRRKKVKQAVFLIPTGFKMVKDPGRVKYYDEYEYVGSFLPKTDLLTIRKWLNNE